MKPISQILPLYFSICTRKIFKVEAREKRTVVERKFEGTKSDEVTERPSSREKHRIGNQLAKKIFRKTP